MEKNQKRITYLIWAFLLIFCISIVYALAAGVLTFQGTANFSEIIDVQFVNESITSIRAGESIDAIASGRTLAFTLKMEEPGDTRMINFNVKNTGNVVVDLAALDFDVSTVEGLIITWPSALENGTVASLAVGATSPTSGTYSVTVEWDEDYPNLSESITIYATIDFDQTVITP